MHIKADPWRGKSQMCPACGYTATGGDRLVIDPSRPVKEVGPGDVALCYNCGTLSMLDRDLNMQLIPRPMWDDLIRDESNAAMALKHTILEVRSRGLLEPLRPTGKVH